MRSTKQDKSAIGFASAFCPHGRPFASNISHPCISFHPSINFIDTKEGLGLSVDESALVPKTYRMALPTQPASQPVTTILNTPCSYPSAVRFYLTPLPNTQIGVHTVGFFYIWLCAAMFEIELLSKIVKFSGNSPERDWLLATFWAMERL